MADKTLREREYEAARESLSRAREALEQAQMAVGVWADAVSQDVEQRLGVDSQDPLRYDDPEYAAALDVVGKVHQAHQDIQQTEQLITWRPSA